MAVVATVLVTLVVVVISFGHSPGMVLVSAQTLSCALRAGVQFNMQCKTYLQSAALSTPSPFCCSQLRAMQVVWGLPCYCEVVVTFNPNLVDMAKVCALPKDCNVAADMSLCPKCSTSTTTPSQPPPPDSSMSPPPSVPSPVLDDPTPPPQILPSPPPPPSVPSPAGVISTPPGIFPSPTAPPASTVPVTPASTTNSASGGSTAGTGSSSLGVPIGASVGGISVALFVIWLIMSRCRIHLKWDVNAACWCCYRSPKPGSAKPGNHNRDVSDHGYRV